MVTTGRGDKIEVRDGGFVANNPTLYAIADATFDGGRLSSDSGVMLLALADHRAFGVPDRPLQ
jgi:hypothetical protein